VTYADKRKLWEWGQLHKRWYNFCFVIVEKLRTNNWYQGNYWNTAHVQEDNLKMEELEKKDKKKMENHPAEIT
jgi:hypothetical protein